MLLGRLVIWMLTAVVVMTSAQAALAQAPPAQRTQPAPFDAAEWQTLVKEKAEIVAQLRELSQAFQTADDQKREELAASAQKLQTRFQTAISPRMVELAPSALDLNAGDVDAAEIMMQVAYGQNRFGEAARLAEVILAQDPQHVLALNVGGVSQFAMHNFEKAVSMFETARQNGGLIPPLGGQYLESAQNYIDYWKVEQAIRAREAAATGDAQLPRVLMKTDKGDILFELFENEAPNTVANFISLVEAKYYDGIAFHRVIPAFMAQGGLQPDEDKAIQYTIKCECYADNARRHFSGTLSMAHAGRDTGGAQFFITHLPTPHLDREIQPESVHTVFGRVVEGMDAAAALQEGDRILSATVVRKRNHDYKPVTQPGG